MQETTSGGGHAVNAGIEYQSRVAAWFAVHVLAEAAVQGRFDLPHPAVLTDLWVEPDAVVDDVIARTSQDGFLFVQVKKNLQLSSKPTSRFGQALDQLLRQYVSLAEHAPAGRSWERPLEPARDRLLLVVSGESSRVVREALPKLLTRIRNRSARTLPSELASRSEEQKALGILRELFEHAWVKYRSGAPSDEQLLKFLELCHVVTVNAEAGGPDEQLALQLLQTTVLSEPAMAANAWSTLVAACTSMAATGEHITPHALRSLLAARKITPKTALSIEGDVARLRTYSERLLGDLAEASEIKLGRDVISIRRKVLDGLSAAVSDGPLIVIGEPGSGKSGVLHQLALAHSAGGADVVFLAVDRLIAQTEAELARSLGILAPLEDVLLGWAGATPGLLVVDALDAARSDTTAAVLRRLLERILRKTSRWRIVASMRKFDLRYSPEMNSLFRGEPPGEFADPLFSNLRHVNVGPLSDDELAPLRESVPQLFSFLNASSPALQKLLRVPFNLRLLAELLGHSVPTSDLSYVRAQVQLLDRYWEHRVIATPSGSDEREAVLQAVTRKMVHERSLRVSRVEIWNQPSQIPLAALTSLLQRNVLAEWQSSDINAPDRYWIVFAHHVLFDYAASRLILRQGRSIQDLIALLQAQRDLIVVLRPSLTMLFQHLWDRAQSRDLFWEFALAFAETDSIAELAKLIAPHVASQEGADLADFRGLLDRFDSDRIEDTRAATEVVRHLFGAVIAWQKPGDAPHKLELWADVLQAVSAYFSCADLLYSSRPLMYWLTENAASLSTGACLAINVAARRMLEATWKLPRYDESLVIAGLSATCKTMAADPSSSIVLLKNLIEPERLREFGYAELPWLADQIPAIAKADATFAARIYEAAFSYEDTSDEKTALGRSQILPLTSNRRQDYAGAWYRLETAFPRFLEIDFRTAVSAAIMAVSEHVRRNHPAESATHEVHYRGRRGVLIEDYSYVWNSESTRHHEAAIKLLSHIDDFLTKHQDDEGSSNHFHDVVDLFVERAQTAALWAWLLKAAATHPLTLGVYAAPLLINRPMLEANDTTVRAGELLGAVFKHLQVQTREQIETAILSISDAGASEDSDRSRRTRDRLLGCLPRDNLSLERTKEILGALDRAQAVPGNAPLFAIHTYSKTYSDEDFLRDQGVDVEQPTHKELLEAERRVKQFRDEFSNGEVTESDLARHFLTLRGLRETIDRSAAARPEAIAHAVGVLAEACETAAIRGQTLRASEASLFVRTNLLEASTHDTPEYDADSDERFNESQSWGSPSPRVHAAAGLTSLARFPELTDARLLDAVDQLSRDPVAVVRHQVAIRLTCLYATANELMWRLLEYVAETEANRGVIDAAVCHPIPALCGRHADRAIAMLNRVLARVQTGPGADDVREHAFSILLDVYVWFGREECGKLVFGLLSEVQNNGETISSLVARHRETLVHGSVTAPGDAVEHAQRKRAIGFITAALQASVREIERVIALREERTRQGQPIHSDDRESAGFRLANTIAQEIYFASGAYRERNKQTKDASDGPTAAQARFYKEAQPLFEQLVALKLVPIAQHVIETLEFFVPLHPQAVFRLIHSAVTSAQAGGYQFESLGTQLVVRVVERYLAEYRDLFADDANMRSALVDILNVFVRAGWPEARQLTYRLSEIYS